MDRIDDRVEQVRGRYDEFHRRSRRIADANDREREIPSQKKKIQSVVFDILKERRKKTSRYMNFSIDRCPRETNFFLLIGLRQFILDSRGILLISG